MKNNVNIQKKDDAKNPPRYRKGIYIGTITVLVIIVVTFIGAPLIGIGANNQNRIIFGSYDRKEIEYRSGNYFSNVYEFLADEMNRENTVINDTFYQFQLRNLWRNAFDTTVEHMATLSVADASNSTVSEDAISKFIIQNPRFQENGKFSVELYRNVGNQEMLNIRNISKEILISTQVRDDLLNNVKLSESESKFSMELLSERRSFHFVTFDLSEYPVTSVQEYALNNANLFRTLDLMQITVDSKTSAQSIRSQLVNDEESFETLARLHSIDKYAEQGGDASSLYAYELQDTLEDADVESLFSLTANDYSEIYETKAKQYTFFQLKSNPIVIQEGAVLTETQLQTIRRHIEINNPDIIETYISDIANTFREESISSTMDNAATKYDRKIVTSPFLSIDYGNELGINEDITQDDELSFLYSINYRNDFFETLFALNPGDISEPLMVQNTFVIASLADSIAPSEDELKNIENIYPGLVKDFQKEYFPTVIIVEEKLKDTFTETYDRVLMPPEPPAEEVAEEEQAAASTDTE